ncbi:uncharacterized protein LOC128241674 [Mya arenaria]|uniref:uncharacterized protein LOC128241674 n=1 Tax=Mya arenaria TaxID=6604 RepID=UPI0022DEC55C|nr:uncharacterized protein LOC128241674 [Mya arenaria]
MGYMLLYLLLVTVMCLSRGVVAQGWRLHPDIGTSRNGVPSASLDLSRNIHGHRTRIGGTVLSNGHWEMRGSVKKDYANGLGWDVSGSTNSRRYSRFGGSLNYRYKNGKVDVHGHVDSHGDFGLGLSWEHRLRRSVKTQRFNVTLMADPCEFDFYDYDKDGGISQKEMAAIFGHEAAAERLFDALDRETVDGVIVREEFAFAPMVIDNCFKNSKGEKYGTT